MRTLILLVLGVALTVCSTVGVTTQTNFELSCSTMGPSTSVTDLSARLGDANVADGQVYVGEGFYEPGTVLFGNTPEQRAEIIWQDAEAKRAPSSIRVSGDKSQWRTRQGLTLGLDLTEVERLNRRPFRLRGFGWDYGGTTTSWSGGVLVQGELPGCFIWARFGNDEERLTAEESRLFRQVSGEREFASGHPGIQAAHARVRRFGLTLPNWVQPGT
jgi:hypothetical protein